MDSISSSTAAPCILIVEDDPELRETIVYTLIQAGCEVVVASCGEDALDLMAAAEFDGVYCAIDLPNRADGWEVGTTFSFIWPDRPVVCASAISAPPGLLRTGVFLRKPFAVAMLARVLRPVRPAGASGSGSAPRPTPENLTAARIKPASSFVYLA
jgi:CheY-like chemotaxis protein